MARVTHIYLHLHPGMFEQHVADAGAFEENKHKREGGKFATKTGTAPARTPATGAAAYAAKHSREAVEAARQAAHEKAKARNPML
jgi:hypothetical protein